MQRTGPELKRDADIEGMTLARLIPSDLPEVARIHCAAFPKAALTLLGTEAVRRYYEWQLTGPHDATFFGCKADERLLGFCVAGRFSGALTGFLRRNRAFLGRQVLTRPAFLLSPFFRQRCWMALQLLWRFHRRPRSSNPSKKGFDILAIAVDPHSQHSGVGRLLMQECEVLARRQECEEMTLSVACDNIQAIRFYERGGWNKVLNDESWEGKMRKRLA
jgi:ribosomal protein S18 acetylase RimI-like enzyme